MSILGFCVMAVPISRPVSGIPAEPLSLSLSLAPRCELAIHNVSHLEWLEVQSLVQRGAPGSGGEAPSCCLFSGLGLKECS